MSDCAAIRVVAFNAKEFGQDYRLTILLLCFGCINVLSQLVQTRVVAKFSSYVHLAPEVNEELGVRCLQLGFGVFIGTTGYSFLLYNAISGCNANEIYIFFFGGMWLVSFDAHEFVRRWPLRVPVLVHHLTVFLVGLAFLEWNLLPPEEDDPVHWTVVLLLSNIGLVWVTDFFHVVFRTSSSLTLIERFRVVYLYLSVFRLVNVGLFGAMAARAALAESYIGLAATASLGMAYIYNTYKAVTFVKNFQCEPYFMAHQAKWSLEADATASATSKKSANELCTEDVCARAANVDPALRLVSEVTGPCAMTSKTLSRWTKNSV
jgi:hypothetical protein